MVASEGGAGHGPADIESNRECSRRPDTVAKPLLPFMQDSTGSGFPRFPKKMIDGGDGVLLDCFLADARKSFCGGKIMGG